MLTRQQEELVEKIRTRRIPLKSLGTEVRNNKEMMIHICKSENDMDLLEFASPQLKSDDSFFYTLMINARTPVALKYASDDIKSDVNFFINFEMNGFIKKKIGSKMLNYASKKVQDSKQVFFKMIENLFSNKEGIEEFSDSVKMFIDNHPSDDVVFNNIFPLVIEYPSLFFTFSSYLSKKEILEFIDNLDPKNKDYLFSSSPPLIRGSELYLNQDRDIVLSASKIDPLETLKWMDTRLIFPNTYIEVMVNIGNAIGWDNGILIGKLDNVPRNKIELIKNSITELNAKKLDNALMKRRSERESNLESLYGYVKQDSKNESENESENENEWVLKDIYINNMTTSTLSDYNYLFKHNIHKLALNSYSGSKKSVLALFTLYSNIVDIRSNTFNETLKKSFSLWKTILKEQSNHFTPDEKVTTEIGLSLKVIEKFVNNLKGMSNFQTSLEDKVKLYKTSRYKNLVDNIVSYMVSFFDHLGIKVKPLPIVSDVSGIKVISLTTDMSEEDTQVRDQLNLVNAIKEKAKKYFLKANRINTQEKEIDGIRYYQNNSKFFSLDTLKTYLTKEELIADVKKNQTLDANYSNVVLDQGKIINPNNNIVIKTLPYLNPNDLESRITEFGLKIDDYNATLKSYETPLTNEPKTIKVGDHSFNVVKVLDKGLSRFVVIEGEYTGHFVDDLISTTGEVIGSKTKASPYLIETSKGMKDVNRYNNFKGQVKVNKFNLNLMKNVTPKNILRLLDQDSFNSMKRIEDISQNIKIERLGNLIGLNVVSNIDTKKTVQASTLVIGTDINLYSTIILPDLECEIARTVVLDNGKPDRIVNRFFGSHKCLPDGLGTRVFAQQVKEASELGFNYIETYAARSSYYVGYYVWPKLGYDAKIDMGYIQGKAQDSSSLLAKYNYLENWLAKNGISKMEARFSDVYACKAGERFIGQELWKKIGHAEELEFDLTPGSLSMRILEKYIYLKSEKDNIDPSEFFNIDYSKYNTLDLECFIEKAIENNLPSFEVVEKNKFNIIKILENSVKNFENGVLYRIYKNPETRKYLIGILYQLKTNNTQLVSKVLFVLKQKGYENIKLGSDEKRSDDPMLKELDMDILNQIWTGISKKYIQ
jgi:hypothetical protein